jgi:hypothetical protein
MNAKLEQWMSARGTRNPVLEAFRDNFDAYDPWGSTIEAQFQICFTLLRYEAQIPAAWEFSPGAFKPTMEDNDPDNEDGEGSLLGLEFDILMREGHYSNLIHAGNVLVRYAAQLKLAGMDY